MSVAKRHRCNRCKKLIPVSEYLQNNGRCAYCRASRYDVNRCWVCGGTDFWIRPSSYIGGIADRVCSTCHPDPSKVIASLLPAQEVK